RPGAGDAGSEAATNKGDRLDTADAGKGDLLVDEVRGLALEDLPPPDPSVIEQPGAPYHLEVYINGHGTRLIAEFFRLADGSWAARAGELREIGLRVPPERADGELVRLAELGVTARYEEATQRLFLEAGDEARTARIYDLGGGRGRERAEVARPGTGLVLNYNLTAAARGRRRLVPNALDGAALNLDGWIYSPLGTISGSGFVRTDDVLGGGNGRFVRLDTTWSYTDRERAVTWQAGDLITSGPAWARAIRLGGGRVSRNFRVRPDIITTPLPTLSGSAAVPTTVDVYLNNVKVFSQEVDPGPFAISNIPVIGSSGEARLVMRDASGREIVTAQRFYVAPQLLRAGLLEFSAAAGLARRRYGLASFDYDGEPVASASARYGVSDRLTVHGHAEVARHLLLGGGGVSSVLFDRVLVEAAGAVSHSRLGTGYLLRGAVQTRIAGLTLSASVMRTFREYADLATVTAETAPGINLAGAVLTGSRMPRALDTVTAGYAFADLGASISAAYVHTRPFAGASTHNLSLNYSQRLFRDISLYASAMIDLKKPKSPALFVGVTIPLGGSRGNVSTGLSRDGEGRRRATVSYDRNLEQKDGSVGWRARGTYGDLKSLQAALAWRTSKATLRASAMRVEDDTQLEASADGALVVADGSIFASNRIHDSFAIVNTGVPGVTVRYENRPIGRTGGDGRLLIPTLRTFERNKISIDPDDLPVDASIPRTKDFVVPPQRSGVVVDFGIHQASDTALVSLVDAAGRPLPVGAEVRLPGRGEPFLVGYDGQTFLEGLRASNTVEVRWDEGACTASFDFTPKPGEQVFIGPVTCR
ncbi:MAG TPA: fimbrial biogenesis outer membrane usher protein, partial [Thermopetrobacter sp.]|nr:fimbrial biogenesis outer membrane usher protein [Thermopetrobacter sp.]